MFLSVVFMLRKKVVYTGTRLLILMHVQHTLPYLYIQPSSWRWTLGFETCRHGRHQKIKIL